MTITSHPLVGMHFRPPAKAILAALPGGAALHVVPEPDNPYDANALAVFVESAAIPVHQHDVLRTALPGMGSTLEEVLAQEAWQLGYIARDDAEALVKEGAHTWAEATGNITAALGFAPNGKPTVIIDRDAVA